MADDKKDAGAEAAEGQAKEGKKGSKKLLIIAIAVVVLLAGGGVLAYTMLSGKKADEETEKKAPQEKIILLAIDPFVVNLAEQGRYLKVTMQFELIDEKTQDLITQRSPKLRDAIITLLSSKSAESVSGPEGKFQLKDELLLRANQAVGKEVFKNLYFTDFVMQ